MSRNEDYPDESRPPGSGWRRSQRYFEDIEQERELRAETAKEERITQEERMRKKEARAQRSLDKYNNMYHHQRMVPVSSLDPEERVSTRPPMVQYGSVYKKPDISIHDDQRALFGSHNRGRKASNWQSSLGTTTNNNTNPRTSL